MIFKGIPFQNKTEGSAHITLLLDQLGKLAITLKRFPEEQEEQTAAISAVHPYKNATPYNKTQHNYNNQLRPDEKKTSTSLISQTDPFFKERKWQKDPLYPGTAQK